jgi:hypothetical protein
MKKNNRNRKVRGASAAASGSDKLFKVIIILLALILVLMVIITAAKINQTYTDYTTRPNDLLMTIRNGYYSEAVHEMHDNIALGETVEKNQDYAIPYALLEYYEAESVYTGYARMAENETDKTRAAELKAKADELKNEMEAARIGMGDLEFMAADIDELFAD